MESVKREIRELKSRLDVTIAAHFYQRDEVFDIADVTGDSLALARRSVAAQSAYVVFCGVEFMGESVKVLDPDKRVLMPKKAACAMADMITPEQFDAAVRKIIEAGIERERILPVAYINCSAAIKAKTGEMDGLICTSSNAQNIIAKARESGKKIFFLPDACLGKNIAAMMELSAAMIGEHESWVEADVICYDGFCSVHQLFTPEDVDFYRSRIPDIKIAVHPECQPAVVEKADFVGSTSMIIQYVKQLQPEEKVAIGTEFNLVNRLKQTQHPETYILASMRPTCATMSETTLEDLLAVLRSIESGEPIHEIAVDPEVARYAKEALDRMMHYS